MASLVIGSLVKYATGSALAGQIAGLAASYLFQSSAADDTYGPRLQSAKVQSSTEGNYIKDVYGTARVAGCLIWTSGIKETAHTQEVGKGGGGQTHTSYTYSASFAVSLCTGPIVGIKRIWADSKLIYNKSDSATADELSISDQSGIDIYTGSEDQEPSPLIEANKGVGNTPAFRGQAYITFDEFQLEKYGNRIPEITAEVVGKGSIQQNIKTNISEYNEVFQPHNNVSFSGRAYYISKNKVCFYVPQWSSNYPPTSTLVKYVYENGNWTSQDIPVVNPRVPPNGITDDPDLYWIQREGPFTDNPESPTYFSSASGHIFTKNDFNVAVHAYYGRIYAKDNTESTIKINAASEVAVCHHNGYIYSINNSGTRIRKYSMALSQISEYTMSSLGTLAVASAKLFPDGNYIYIMPVTSGGYFHLYRINTDFNNFEHVGYFYLGNIVGTYYNMEFNIDSNILTVAWGYTSVYYNNHIQIVQFLISDTITSLEVDVKDIIDDITTKVTLPVNSSSLFMKTKGYVISNQIKAKDALEPLLQTYNISAVESDYQLIFETLHGTVDHSIDESDLSASYDKKEEKLSIARGDLIELPRRIEVKYPDFNGDYQEGNQFAQRIKK